MKVSKKTKFSGLGKFNFLKKLGKARKAECVFSKIQEEVYHHKAILLKIFKQRGNMLQ
jgi:hypothetical protein